MALPLEISLRDIDHTPAIDAKIRQKAEKLTLFYDRITHCRVAVEAIQKNKHQGKVYQVNIELHVPGKKVLIVNRQRNEDLYVAIRDSFDAMKEQLENYARKLRGYTKTHQPQLQGKVVRLFPDYGFIETLDGKEYYFHETHLLQIQMSDLIVGTEVRFLENVAGDGLQADQVSMV